MDNAGCSSPPSLALREISMLAIIIQPFFNFSHYCTKHMCVLIQEMDIGDHLVLRAELNPNDPGKSLDVILLLFSFLYTYIHRATHRSSHISTTRVLLVH